MEAAATLAGHPQFVAWKDVAGETEFRATVRWPGDEERLAEVNVLLVHTTAKGWRLGLTGRGPSQSLRGFRVRALRRSNARPGTCWTRTTTPAREPATAAGKKPPTPVGSRSRV